MHMVNIHAVQFDIQCFFSRCEFLFLFTESKAQHANTKLTLNRNPLLENHNQQTVQLIPRLAFMTAFEIHTHLKENPIFLNQFYQNNTGSVGAVFRSQNR